jgi:hypothetical protein
MPSLIVLKELPPWFSREQPRPSKLFHDFFIAPPNCENSVSNAIWATTTIILIDSNFDSVWYNFAIFTILLFQIEITFYTKNNDLFSGNFRLIQDVWIMGNPIHNFIRVLLCTLNSFSCTNRMITKIIIAANMANISICVRHVWDMCETNVR